MTLRTLVMVATGGALGSVLRYVCSLYIQLQHNGNFPWGTFVVNIVGCFLIGLFIGWGMKTGHYNSETVLFLTTGFCGGFTTFSTFSIENIYLIRSNHWELALTYTGASLALGFLATYFGMFLFRNI